MLLQHTTCRCPNAIPPGPLVRLTPARKVCGRKFWHRTSTDADVARWRGRLVFAGVSSQDAEDLAAPPTSCAIPDDGQKITSG